MADHFDFAADPISLPKGAWARTERRTLRLGGNTVFSLTQGRFRHFLFPVYTPQGFAVTSEAPADHPHHNSVWIASDHIRCWMPVAGGGVEEYTYNLYLDETFQGRAPGAIIGTGAEGRPIGPHAFRIVQTLDWRGPGEWAAPEGRLLMREVRTLDVAIAPNMYVIDVTSQITAANWNLSLGPTRHAYFSVRMAESIAVTAGGTVQDDRGHQRGDRISGEGARWVDYSGPVGGKHRAGIAVCPHPADHQEPFWFVSDWGVITTGPFRRAKCDLLKDQALTLRYRLLVHDGDAADAQVAMHMANYLEGAGSL